MYCWASSTSVAALLRCISDAGSPVTTSNASPARAACISCERRLLASAFVTNHSECWRPWVTHRTPYGRAFCFQCAISQNRTLYVVVMPRPAARRASAATPTAGSSAHRSGGGSPAAPPRADATGRRCPATPHSAPPTPPAPSSDPFPTAPPCCSCRRLLGCRTDSGWIAGRELGGEVVRSPSLPLADR